jgi:hypothetical protein
VANAYLLGHGARDTNEPKTFVPDGKSISFYAEFDEYALQSIGLAVLNAGDITPTETYESGEEIPNYLLQTFTDDELAKMLSAESSRTDGTLYFVGQSPIDDANTKLCTTPNACRATYPDHSDQCGGVFSKITEDTIFSVSCRGVLGAENQATWEMEGTTDYMTELRTEAARILTWKDTEEQAAIDYLASLSEVTRAEMYTAYPPLQTWAQDFFKGGGTVDPAAVIDARNYLETHGDVAFYTYVEQMDIEQRGMVLGDDALLTAFWVGYGRGVLQDQGAPAFYEWWRTLDQPWLDTLANDPELGQAIGQGSQGADVAEAPAWAPSTEDFDEARQFNEAFVKDLDEGVDATWEVGGALVLLGEPGGELASRVRQQPDHQAGSFRVKRATFGAGSLVFKDVPPVLQDTVTWTVGQFSRKDVEFE